MGVISPCLSSNERKHWWLSNRMIVEKYIRDVRNLIATQDQGEVAVVRLLEAALVLSPQLEQALELKARSLLHLRRLRDVADILQDCIPRLKMASDDSDSDNSFSQSLSRHRVKLLHSEGQDPSIKCSSSPTSRTRSWLASPKTAIKKANGG